MVTMDLARPRYVWSTLRDTIPSSAGQLLGDDPPRCQQTVVKTCVPALVSSSRRWTGQKIDHPVRVVNASRAASPAVEFPDGPSAGLHTQIVQRSGMTARMPPPTPLFAGNPTR